MAERRTDVGRKCDVSNDVCNAISRFRYLKVAFFDCSTLTDIQLGRVCEPGTIECLGISGTFCTNAGIATLSRLPRLQSLDAAWLEIDNDAADALTKCRRLKHINVSATHITDSGLRKILSNPQVSYLGCYACSATEEEINRLRVEFPKVTIASIELEASTLALADEHSRQQRFPRDFRKRPPSTETEIEEIDIPIR